MSERKSFVFYASWLEAIENLPTDMQGDALLAIAKYGLRGEEVAGIRPIAKAMLTMVKTQIDANNARYEAGCKGADYGKLGGRPRKNPKETPKKPLENPKETPNEPLMIDDRCKMSNVRGREREKERESGTAPSNDERNGAERKARSLAPSKFFGDFWDAFPRTARKTARNKAFAIEIWREMRLDEKREQIMAALEWWKCSSQWSDFNFVPAPQNWLRCGSWDIDTNSVREASKQASSLKESHSKKLTPAQLKTAEEDYERLLSTKAEIGLTPDQEAELKELREKIKSSYNL